MTSRAMTSRRTGPDEPGAEGGSGGSADVTPAAPSDDDAPLGDTDQHSDAQA